jgi:hypothetical protein
VIAKLFSKVMGRRKRKNHNRIRKIIYTLDSSSSDQSSCTGNKEKRQCTQNKDKVNTSEVNSDLSNYMNNSSQYTQMTSTPNMAYQQNYSPVYPTHPLPPHPALSATTAHVTRDIFCIERNLSKTFQRRD